MKKIFIFKPIEAWSYCGGGRACIANSFDEAATMFEKDGSKMLVNEPTEEETKKDTCGWYDNWVLVATYGVTGDPPLGIVLDDFNWS